MSVLRITCHCHGSHLPRFQFFVIFIYLCVTGCVYMLQLMCAGQQTTFWGWLSLSTMWVLGIQVRLSLLATRTSRYPLSPTQCFESGSLRVSKVPWGSIFLLLRQWAMLLPFFQDCFSEQGGDCFMTHSFTPRSLEMWAHYDWLRCQIQCWEVSNTDPLSFSVSSHSRVHIHAQHRHSTPLTLFLLTFTFPRWMKPWPHLLGIP